MRVEKFDRNKVWSVALFDADAGYKYLKRFQFEPSQKRVNFLGDNPKSELILITDTFYPRIQVVFGGMYANREPVEIDVDEFIGIKGVKAKGKRIHTWEIKSIEELEPTRFPEIPPEEEKTDVEPETSDEENDGQMMLF